MQDILTEPRMLLMISLSLFTITVTVALNLINRKRRSLSYEIVGSAIALPPLLGQISDSKGVLVRLQNTGNEEIVADDYMSDLTVDFGEYSKVKATMITTYPQGVETNDRIIGHEIVLRPNLLNPGDGIDLFAVLEDFEDNISVQGRVVGVSKIRKHKYQTDIAAKLSITAAFAMFIIGLLLTFLNAEEVLTVTSISVVTFCGSSITFNLVGIARTFLRYRKFHGPKNAREAGLD